MAKWIELNNEVKIQDENGQYQYSKDREAVYSYFVDHVNKKMQYFHDFDEKLKYLLKHDYWDSSVIKKYKDSEIKELHKIVYGHKFRFKSFMSAFKFYNNYALKTNDGANYLERYEDRVMANALFLGDGDFEKAKAIAKQLIKQNYQPATPTFLNAMRSRAGRLVSCFLLQMPDSTEGIFYINEAVAQLSRFGGGVAVNLSVLRGADEPIKGMEGASTSVVGIAKILEDIARKFNQLGQREGAVAVYINAFHSDSKAMLSTKKINADENERLKTLSLGLIIPSKLYELAEKDEQWFSFYPNSVFKAYGVHLDDMHMDEMYDELLNNPAVRKKPMGSARAFFEEIGKTQLESGYPYILNRDVANKVHMLKDIGDIKMSNLCVEILQLQTHSHVESHKGTDEFGYDISCNLGSLNIANVMENKEVKDAVKIAIDALTTVTRKTSIDEVPSVKKANDSFRSVGLGVMNLHGYLAKNFISYESREAKDFANVFFAMMRFYALERSMELAKEYSPFDHFEKSEYAKGTALTRYIEKSHAPKTDKVAKLFEGIYIPTQEDWERLNEQIMEHGIYSAYLLAIAPTGSISYVQNATPSVMPITEKIETRKYGDSTTHYPMPFLNARTWWFYKEAYQMDMMKLIDLMAVIQLHVDQSISTTLFVDDETTDGQLARHYIYAHKKGLKTLYYTRTKVSSQEDCLSCTV
ncbi:class 1b ribonucleoside-diphosphate reductase subunit alpha [Bacillus paranthracis]|uniref:class 1b ribonucleoside-diphosphate reductase subunit alpha n=1 Tax=Bacillus cereus group TaxID=86661 RepID=UPI00202CF933|nr:class 1b ribonucleoside-diphosphate reductase subunit alpha [Bacillus paranthracis]MCM0006138.1 class 1b ribonucleoside-diphosphate reductase subunit alpha [Bacillus paranthracis]MDX6046750.1 class 1b ribonucleoside-diphosphate reductase subunit alpha [Bacillus paranthracis]